MPRGVVFRQTTLDKMLFFIAAGFTQRRLQVSADSPSRILPGDTTDYRTIEISDPLEEIYNLFCWKSLPDCRKSFCSTFAVFLRETFLFVESSRGGERPTPPTPHALLLSFKENGRFSNSSWRWPWRPRPWLWRHPLPWS